jgi:phospholipase/lecithinase/hemolysin
MKRLLIAGILSAMPALSLASPLDRFSTFAVIGDSLSDGGNVAILTGGAQPDPTVFPGSQFTDGDTWATKLGLTPSLAGGTNYAFGGARARDDGAGTPDALAQVSLLLADGVPIDDDTLLALWLGGNDVRDAFGTVDETTLAGLAFGTLELDAVVASLFADGSILKEALDAISGSLDLLTLTPVKNVAVVGLPNFARVPEVIAAASDAGAIGGTVLDLATAVSRTFNAELQAKVAALAAQGIHGSYVDIFALFEEVAADPAAFGLTDIQTPCLVALRADPLADCSDYLFYDGIHPTDAGHALIAGRFTATVAPIPLPASVAFLLGGVGGLLVLRRRSAIA